MLSQKYSTYLIVENLREFLASDQVREENEKGTPLHIGNRVAMYVDEDGVYDSGRTIDDNLLGQFLDRSDYKFIL